VIVVLVVAALGGGALLDAMRDAMRSPEEKIERIEQQRNAVIEKLNKDLAALAKNDPEDPFNESASLKKEAQEKISRLEKERTRILKQSNASENQAE
jgi:t-SNARE complex subunit (syntaxin)